MSAPGESLSIDRVTMCRDRLDRAIAEMERDDLDAMILGRESNARYVSGASRLWTVGTRPFGPGCVVTRRDAAVYLVSSWDEGIPEEIPHENLIGMTWNPRNTRDALLGIDALRSARRIAVDGMTAHQHRSLSTAFPNVDWADATSTLDRARRIKTPAEVACLREACGLAERAFDAMAGEIEPGTSERFLTGRFQAEAARLGATIQAVEAGFCGASGRAGATGPESIARERALVSGELVVCQAGVLVEGYEGGIGVTRSCATEPTAAQHRLAEETRDLLEQMVAACRPGLAVAELGVIYDASHAPRPRIPILYGLGLGMEAPIVDLSSSESRAELEAGMVVAVQAFLEREGVGGVLARDTLHIKAGGSERLNRQSLADFESKGSD